MAEKKYEISFTISWCRPWLYHYPDSRNNKVRDAIIEKFSDKSLLELNSFIETALGTEQNENKRLGILAARVYILRVRMQNIASFNSDPLQTSLPEVTPADLMRGRANQPTGEEASGEGTVSEEVYQEWNELTVIEAGEINGVRIPKGVTITVGIEDARRLIETNKAIFTKGSAESVEGRKQAEPFSQKIIQKSKDRQKI